MVYFFYIVPGCLPVLLLVPIPMSVPVLIPVPVRIPVLMPVPMPVPESLPPEPAVFVARATGRRFHRRRGCSRAAHGLSLSDAIAEGFTPCRKCWSAFLSDDCPVTVNPRSRGWSAGVLFSAMIVKHIDCSIFGPRRFCCSCIGIRNRCNW